MALLYVPARRRKIIISNADELQRASTPPPRAGFFVTACFPHIILRQSAARVPPASRRRTNCTTYNSLPNQAMITRTADDLPFTHQPENEEGGLHTASHLMSFDQSVIELAAVGRNRKASATARTVVSRRFLYARSFVWLAAPDTLPRTIFEHSRTLLASSRVGSAC